MTHLRIGVLVAAGIALLLGCRDASGPENRRVIIAASPSSFRVGDSVAITLTYSNGNREPYGANVLGCPYPPFLIRDSLDHVVAPARLKVDGCDAIGIPLIMSGETRSFVVQWKPAGLDVNGIPLPPGSYQLESRDSLWTRSPVPTRILP
jgi:hypothetical protein